MSELGDTWNNSIGLEFSYIPPCTFVMGAENGRGYAMEQPIRTVEITKPFAIGRTEVTLQQFIKFLNAQEKIQSDWLNVKTKRFPLKTEDSTWSINEENTSLGYDENLPMVYVTYLGAQAFCKWLSEKEGKSYRLPSEAEWEYACRAGSNAYFTHGDTLTTDMANYNGTLDSKYGIGGGIYRQKTLPVKSFAPNKWGLYDMHGNVWEFCEDFWHENFQSAPTSEIAWKTGGDSTQCVIKGGSWYTHLEECRSSTRFGMPIDEPNSAWGFRVVLEIN